MKQLRLKNTPEQVELVKALGSKDPAISRPAMEAIAALVGPIVQKVLSVAGSASAIYSDMPYNEDDSPSLPLDLYYGANENHIQVWSQTMAGGLPTSQVTGLQEMKFATYTLDSAVSFLKRYARKARLDVLSAAIKRMTEEILVKQERNGWAVIMKAAAEASTNSLSHIIDSTTDDVFQVDDLNRLLTRIDRINTAWAGYTPADNSAAGITDLYISPEIMEQIRAFAYQPMNTRAVPNTDESTAVPLPDGVRNSIYNAPNVQEIYGVGLTKLLELGDGKKYNTLFDSYYSSTFTGASDQIVIGVDNSRGAFIRPVATNSDVGTSVRVLPDDQFVARADKTGLYTAVEQGNICIDSRAIVGCIV